MRETSNTDGEAVEPTQQVPPKPAKYPCKKRESDAPNDTGYQFVQSRGPIVLETPMGLVAVLPVGMATVSSVAITAEVGVTLRKGEEMGIFPV